MLVAALIASAMTPAETPCGESCPCDGPPGADGHAEDGSDVHGVTAEAAHEHESDEHEADERESGDPCDDDCPDDCPSCGGAAVALVTPALGMPVRRGGWRAVSASLVRDTVHRSASSGVFRPPRQLG